MGTTARDTPILTTLDNHERLFISFKLAESTLAGSDILLRHMQRQHPDSARDFIDFKEPSGLWPTGD